MKTKLLSSILLILFLILGCAEKNYEQVFLPNGYETLGEKVPSIAHPGSTNIRSSEGGLEEKSYEKGIVTYIGLMNIEDDALSINHIRMEANGGNGGLILSEGGKALNNVTIYDYAGIIVKIKVNGEKEYLMQLKSYNYELSPAISLEYLREGGEIFFPTVREYENSGCGCGGSYLYRILNEVDYLYLHEIEKAK